MTNTPDGEPVCDFLDKFLFRQISYPFKETNKILLDTQLRHKGGDIDMDFEIDGPLILKNIKLNYLLYTTFTQALFNGKDFETALEEANAVYLKNI